MQIVHNCLMNRKLLYPDRCDQGTELALRAFLQYTWCETTIFTHCTTGVHNMPFQPGLYFIVASWDNGFCIDMPSEHASDKKALIQLYHPTGGYTQKWDFQIENPDSPLDLLIKWHFGEKYLQPKNESQGEEAKIQFAPRNKTAFQRWRVESSDDSRHYIINTGSGLALTATGNQSGSDIKQGKKITNNDGQLWFLQPTQP